MTARSAQGIRCVRLSGVDADAQSQTRFRARRIRIVHLAAWKFCSGIGWTVADDRERRGRAAQITGR